MPNRAVALIINAKTDAGWRRYPAMLARNGRARAGFGLVAGEPVEFSQYRYELRSYVGSKVTYKPVGADAQQAVFARDKAQRTRNLRIEAAEVGEQLVDREERVLLRAAADRYVKRAEDSQANEAAQVYRTALDHFLEAVAVRYVDEVNEDVMLVFHGALRKRGNGPRTIANKHTHVKGFLMWAGVAGKQLGRKPKFEKKIPIVYEPEEIATLIEGIDSDRFRVVIDVLRMAGLRDQEARHLMWQDIDFKRGLILVRSKPDLGFLIKDKEERDVPMVPQLAGTLRAWKENHHPKSPLVLATRTGKVNKKWLFILKRAARRAGLNCGRCDACREREECERFTLHAFRRTYATMLSRSGIDVRTIMMLMGHSEIQTTLSYLAPMSVENAQVIVNRIKW